MIKNINELPPIKVIKLYNNKYFIIDGHNRYIAFSYIGHEKIKAEIIELEICSKDVRQDKYMKMVLRELFRKDFKNIQKNELVKIVNFLKEYILCRVKL